MKATSPYLNRQVRTVQQVLAQRFGTVGLVLHKTPPTPLHGPVPPWNGHAEDVLFNDGGSFNDAQPIIPAWWWKWSAIIIGAGVLYAVWVR